MQKPGSNANDWGTPLNTTLAHTTYPAYVPVYEAPPVAAQPPQIAGIVFGSAVAGLASGAVRKPVSRRGLLGMFRGGSDDRDN